MQLNSLKRQHPNKKFRQVGRGGTRGKTSGRGGKGQTARAGNKRRPEIRDIIKKLPKLRGYRFHSVSVKFAPVNVGALDIFETGMSITPSSILDKNLVRRTGGKIPSIKILGTGELSKKLTITGCKFSTSAKEKIEKAGGSIK